MGHNTSGQVFVMGQKMTSVMGLCLSSCHVAVFPGNYNFRVFRKKCTEMLSLHGGSQCC